MTAGLAFAILIIVGVTVNFFVESLPNFISHTEEYLARFIDYIRNWRRYPAEIFWIMVLVIAMVMLIAGGVVLALLIFFQI